MNSAMKEKKDSTKKMELVVENRKYEVTYDRLPSGEIQLNVDGRRYRVNISKGRDQRTLSATLEGKTFEVNLPEFPKIGKTFKAEINSEPFTASIERITIPEEAGTPLRLIGPALAKREETLKGLVQIKPPLPGKISSIRVKEGDKVNSGDVVVILEAMKMENEVTTPKSGTVRKVNVFIGQNVAENDPLILIET